MAKKKKAAKKKVAKKVAKKKVAKKVAKKKVAKKVAKKKVAKKVAKKKVAKKVAKKKVAKKVAKKKVIKEKDTVESQKLSREEAIVKYQEQKKTMVVEESFVESPYMEDRSGKEKKSESFSFDDEDKVESFDEKKLSGVEEKLTRDYNPDDEVEDESSGEYGYGWGYNDSFDKPDDEFTEDEEDEDLKYAKGLDKNEKEEER